jgi:hypothetical protein
MSKLTKEIFKEAQAYAGKIVKGLATSVSPFHSVATIKALRFLYTKIFGFFLSHN